MPNAIADDVLQDYLAGRLSAQRCASITAALAADPALASRLLRMQDEFENLTLITGYHQPLPREWVILLRASQKAA